MVDIGPIFGEREALGPGSLELLDEVQIGIA